MLSDRLRGAFLGLALGDALGAPYEFKYSFPLTQYNGTIYQPIKWRARFKPMQYSAIGQVTDDTTMTIALLYSIVKNKNWIKNDVIQSYVEWANCGIKFIGKNTRSLFYGIKTLKGYKDRYQRLDLTKMESNGSLMRAFPLLLLFYYLPEEEAYQQALNDTNLTNPTTINQDATLIYLTALRLILNNTSVDEALPQLMNIAQTSEIREAIIQADQDLPRNITHNKGWVVHTLYCAIYAWIKADRQHQSFSQIIDQSFSQIIDQIILKGGDTDTNASVSMALVGLIKGENNMYQESITSQNLNIILSADTNQGNFPLDIKYHPASAINLLNVYQ